LLHRPSAGDRRRTPVRLKPIEGTPTKTYKIAAIPGDGIGTEVVDAGVEVLKELAKRETNFAFSFRSFRLGLRVLQEARAHDAGERPRPDPAPRRHALRIGQHAKGDAVVNAIRADNAWSGWSAMTFSRMVILLHV
jgi:hypothetical protein